MTVEIKTDFLSPSEVDLIYKEAISNKTNWSYSMNTAMSIYGKNLLRLFLKCQDKPMALEEYRSTKNIESVAHQILLDKMTDKFGNAQFIPSLGKPGIQTMHGSSQRIWHYDDEKVQYPYQWYFEDYTGPGYFDNYYTFTIMLSIGDFTYDYFPETLSSYKDNPLGAYCKQHQWLKGDTCPNPECTLKDYTTLEYQPGQMILTEGRYLHRIGKSTTPDKLRMTLQGHAVTKNDIFYMYW